MRLFALPIFDASGHNETSEITFDRDEPYSESSSFFYHIMLIVGGSSTACCIVANLLTVFVLIRHRPLQKSISNLYVLSLSVADLFIGITVMFPMFFNEIKNGSKFDEFFGPFWICKGWQIFDFIFSTISLYSTCAIAFDRVWNLEKPLRVFKRSRRLAKRLIMGIWLFPILIWAPIFFLFLESDNFGNDGCLMSRNRAHIIPIIAIPILYVPAMILIAMFVRISLVVHRHLKFLREHSSVPQLNSNSPLQERTALSVNSINRDCNSSLRAPEQKRNTFESLTTVTSGYCTTTLRTPRSNSPWFPRSTEFQLAPLSEEKSSGRERSQSEQINLTPEVQNSLKIADSRSHSKIDTSSSVPTRRESIVAKQLLLMQRAEAFFHRKPSAESVGRLARATSCRSRYSSSDSTGSSIGGPVKIFRKFSNLSRASSKRFSVIAIHSNLTDLLLREGVSHQVKAAKAVALITCCFLCCWFPFLIVWPIKIYCHTCVPEQFYRWCVWLNYLCSAINPILYTLSSPRVRSALKKYASFASYRSKMRMKAASFYKSNTLV